MNDVQKWIFDREYRDMMAVLPDYMKVRTVEPFSLLVFTVRVQRGFYKDQRVQFLIDIPNNYGDVVSFRF